MKIGFLISRLPFYKHFGSLIDEALKEGHRVFCLHDYSQPQTGNKAYQFPWIKGMPRFKNGIAVPLTFKNDDEFLEIVKHNQIDVLVSLHFCQAYLNVKQVLEKQGVKWVALQNGLDSIFSAEFIPYPDLFLYYSKEWFNFAIEYTEKTKKPLKKKELEKKSAFIGFPELNQVEMVNPLDVKKKWGIGENQKVVLLLPFPFGATNDRFWAKYIYGKHNPLFQIPLSLFKRGLLGQVLRKENDFQLCSLLKQFCLKNDAFLLVKSRKKDPVRPYLAKIADKVLYDEQEYPSTIVECFSVADLCIGFLSTAVLESIGLGVPSLSVLPPIEHYRDIQNPLWQMLLQEKRDLFEFEEGGYLLSIKESFKALKEKSLSDFKLSSESQLRYVQKYVGPRFSSREALLAIKKLLA